MRAHGGTASVRPIRRSDSSSTALRAAVSLFLVAHALAHLVGTSQAFDAAAGGTSLDYLGGAWHISLSGTLRLAGIAWAVVAVAYAVAALGEWLGWRNRWRYLTGVTVCSLVLTVVALPETAIGVIVDLGILTGLAVAHRQGTWP